MWQIFARDVDGAKKDILDVILRNKITGLIYFDGWSGFGAAPVLRSLAQEFWSIKAKETPPELCFHRIIYIDCSKWKNIREVQRKIAEELDLDVETMAIFDKQDEEDDFNGRSHGSRQEIQSVSEVIDLTLGYKKLMMIFLNGSDDEVDVRELGITLQYRGHVIIWTFKRRSLLTLYDLFEEKAGKLKYTNHFIGTRWAAGELTSSQFHALLREEAASIVVRHPCMRMWGIDQTMVRDCSLYELFLKCSFHRATGSNWASHASNYWMCDGIIKCDGKREISSAFASWECGANQLGKVFKKLMEDPEAPFLIVKDDISLLRERHYRWICVTSKNMIVQGDMKSTLERASSLFVALEKSDNPQGLPNGFLNHCSNLGVLILSGCAFSFASPPFHQCHGLRFLGLNHCTNDSTVEGENNTEWVCLKGLWVLDLRYTEWDDILSEENMDIMANLRELNIEGFMCCHLTGRLQGRLPYLRRLRIIKPAHRADTTCHSFMDKTELEILDLSGNKDIGYLSISPSTAKSLKMLILDGCDGLEKVVVPDGIPSLLRLFSFDGYGPAPHRKSFLEVRPPKSSTKPERLPDVKTSKISLQGCMQFENDVKTSKISLQGCMQFENLFVRGLPKLFEVDLSGSAIKILDLETVLVNLPELKRLILLGCEHLCAIKWGYKEVLREQLELLCVDTRPWRAHVFTRPCLAQHKSFRLQLHATLADSRLARSFYRPLYFQNVSRYEGIYFNIHVTSSFEHGGGAHQLETTEMDVLASLYSDAFLKIGDTPMVVFPQPPTQQSDHHIEISDGSHGLETELANSMSLAYLMAHLAESLHVHHASTSAIMPVGSKWKFLKCCRVERCLAIDTVFPSEAYDWDDKLEVIWVSHLLMARCIWSKGLRSPYSFKNLQHLHLRSCPRLQFVLPVWVSSFRSLETLHIIHCGDLTHVFVLDGKYPEEIVIHGVPFPKLTTIHLHDMSKLQQIMCDEVKMLAPALETIKIRGCFGLRRLPSLQDRESDVKRPTVEMEKDVWDALEWDGLAAGHHPDLFEPPVHSRYYRQSRLLKGTVLR